MKKIKLKICLMLMVFTMVACMNYDDNNSFNTVSERDETFLLNAADGGMFEVKAGELAVAKGDSIVYIIGSDSLSVRSFGQMMITDHIKANGELKTLADQRQVAIPATLSTLKQQKLDSLSAASGAVFTLLYVKMMVSSHQESIALFQSESNAGDDNEIKSWAAGKLPTLESHLDRARNIQDSIR